MKKLSCVMSFMVLSFIFVNNIVVHASVERKQSSDFQGRTGFLPDISEFKINIEKPKKEIRNSLNTAKPLRKSLNQATEEIKAALEAVKQNRTQETLDQLQFVFSESIYKIDEKMVGVIKEKDRIKDSFKEIDRELEKAKTSLGAKLQKLSDDAKINSGKLEELQKKSSELARKYMDEQTDELKEELYLLKNKIDTFTYSNQQTPGQIEVINKAVAMVDGKRIFYRKLSSHTEHLLDKLNVERQKFSSAAEVCRMMMIFTVPESGLSGDGTAIELYTQVQDVWDTVDGFSGIMNQVTDELTRFLVNNPDGKSIEIDGIKWNDDLEEWITKQAETYF
ncbi:MAG: hypothetical protein ACE5KZ_08715 [Candidatus Scalinduaceae bacterium]